MRWLPLFMLSVVGFAQSIPMPGPRNSGTGSVPKTLISHTSTINGIPSSAIDTTGATLYVCASGSLPSNTCSDSNSSTGWTCLTPVTANQTGVICYTLTPIPGSSVTFSATGGLGSTEFAAFSGVTAFDQQNGASNGASGYTAQAGSVTPTANGELLVAAGSFDQAISPFPPTINLSYTITDSVQFGSIYGSSMAYLIQTTAAASNPTWTMGSSGTFPAIAALIATFK